MSRIAEVKARYEQERLRLQYEQAKERERLAHQVRMEEKRLAHEKQQIQLEQEMEKERLAHAERAHRLKKQQKDEAIAECKEHLADFDKKIETATNRKEEINEKYCEKNEEIKVLDKKISQFDFKRTKELEQVAIDIELDSAKQAFDRVENEINAAIEKTALQESSIGQFLGLIQGLTNATLSNQDQANKLIACTDYAMETFGNLMGRGSSRIGQLSIQNYFEWNGMTRFIPILAKEGYINMNDLICEGDDKEQEFDNIMDLIATGLEEEYEQWEMEKNEFEKKNNEVFETPEPKRKLTFREKRFVKVACLRPERWQREQDCRNTLQKRALDEISPLLIKFFDKMHSSAKHVQAALSYNGINDGILTEEQHKMIEQAPKLENQNEMKLIQTWEITSFESTKKIFEQSMALNKAAIMSINVIDSMYDEFEGSPNKAKALGLAQSIEHTCMEIVRNIGEIRQSLLLANCILKMKPANLTAKSKELWDAVDSGIIQIFQNALEMSRRSSNYFGFFLKFEQSFNYYLAARDKSLLISTEHLQTDIKEFKKLSSNFNKEVAKLGGSAMDCITGCVKNMAVAANFEKNRADRERKLQTYLRKKKVYDSKDLELSAEYGTLLDQRADAQAQASSYKPVMDSLDQLIQHDTKMRASTHKTLQSLLG